MPFTWAAWVIVLPGTDGSGSCCLRSRFTHSTVPREGDRVEALGLIFEVIDMDNHRLDKVLVMPKALPRPPVA